MRMLFWAASVTLLLDQASKILVVWVLNLREVLSIEVLPPVFNLRMAWNTGINFGLLAQDSAASRWALVAVALVIVAAVLWWVRSEPGGRWRDLAAGLLVGGALGNVVDRLVYGAVADFINMSCCGIRNPFAFNIADIAIFAGAIGLVLASPGKNAA